MMATTLHPHRVAWIELTKREGVWSECSATPDREKFGLRCKANKRNDAETSVRCLPMKYDRWNEPQSHDITLSS